MIGLCLTATKFPFIKLLQKYPHCLRRYFKIVLNYNYNYNPAPTSGGRAFDLGLSAK